MKVPREKFDNLNKLIGLDSDNAANVINGVYGKIYGKIDMPNDDTDDNYVRVQDGVITRSYDQPQG